MTVLAAGIALGFALTVAIWLIAEWLLDRDAARYVPAVPERKDARVQRISPYDHHAEGDFYEGAA